MAVSLKGDAVGELVDPFGGRADLQAGSIRILHDRSFIDDPTRILRAIRYEDRYGFRMDEDTARLARECIATGPRRRPLGRAPAGRADRAASRRATSSHAIPRLAELGAEKRSIRTSSRTTRPSASSTRSPRAERRSTASASRSGGSGSKRSGASFRTTEIGPWLHGLKVRRRDAELIAAAIEDGPRIAEQVGQDSLTPADVVALAEPRAPDAPLFALALADRRSCTSSSAASTAIGLEIDGADVAAARTGRVAREWGDPRRGSPLEAERRARGRGVGARSRAGADRAAVSVPSSAGTLRARTRSLFTTRVGGVSEGPFESLNLGRRTGDDVERVDENRRRLCAEVGADDERLDARLPDALHGRQPRRSRLAEALRATASGRTSPASRCSPSAPTAR